MMTDAIIADINANFPPELKADGKFCVWSGKIKADGKPDKQPLNPRNPQWGADSSDPNTFAPLLVAEDTAKRYNYGIGMGLFDGIGGIDVDHCIADGKLSESAQDVISIMSPCYVEVSPSGEGIHILFRAPGFSYDTGKYYTKNPHNGVELYISGMSPRYFTVTGNVLDGHGEMDQGDASSRLQIVLDKYMRRDAKDQKAEQLPAQGKGAAAPAPVELSDNELIAKAKTAKNGDLFSRLWAGFSVKKSPSEDDLALCNLLAFWTGCDAERMDRLFRLSGLMREKWDEKRGGKTYGEMTIEKAIKDCRAVYNPTGGRAAAAPDQEGQTAGKRVKPRLTWQALASEMTLRGYMARYNVITKSFETIGRTPAGRPMSQDDLAIIMHDELAGFYTGASVDNILMDSAFIARENQYNPVLDLLRATPWDKRDRLPQVYSLLGIEEEDTLSKALIYKWLLQCVALLFNTAEDPFGADGALVLNGLQRTGKTSFFAHLAMENKWFGGGLSVDDRDKDSTRRILGVWIAELGELESTQKADVAMVKAFVTNAYDAYRLPYGRSDTTAPRTTSLCGTCNSAQYLVDSTGNQRWWSVPLQRFIPREELLALDALQLWAQIFAIVDPLDYKQKSACYRLSPDERAALDLRNGNYEKPLKGESEVRDILARATAQNFTVKQMTVSEFKGYWPELRPYSVQQIGIALTRCGIDANRTNKERSRPLPMPFGALK